MVPSGPTVGDEVRRPAPRLIDHTISASAPPLGARNAYSVPSMSEPEPGRLNPRYTVPSGDRAGVACHDDPSGGWNRHDNSRLCPSPAAEDESCSANSTPWWLPMYIDP